MTYLFVTFPDIRKNTMIKIKTNNPIAVDSDDHKHPEGIHLDNNLNIAFVNQVESYFQHNKINYMDLGCAGGELVCEMHRRGHTVVGIDGSDRCLNPDPKIVRHSGLPKGYHNWQKYHKTLLFTCDITKDYTIYDDENLMQFDLITCWDVMEHFEENQVDNFLTYLTRHMKPNGMFVASIALFSCAIDRYGNGTVEYHKTLKDKEWWLSHLNNYLTEVPNMFTSYNRTHIDALPYLFFVGKLK